VVLKKPPILLAVVVGVTAVGVDGSVVRSAKATIPFLARLTGHGVGPAGADAPVNVSLIVPVPLPKALLAVSWTLYVPTLVGVPKIVPFVLFRLKPAGSALPKLTLVGFLFTLGKKEKEVPTVPLAS
jgi:hypothetical protein